MTDPPTIDRYATAQRLADEDPYWRAYMDGLTDKHHIKPPETPGASSCPKETR